MEKKDPPEQIEESFSLFLLLRTRNWYSEKVTAGITASSPLRVLIDEEVCDLDVGLGPP